MSLALKRHKGAVQPPRYVWTKDEIGSNELLYSEDFTEITGWSTTGINVTENAATAPDGTLTMTTLEDPDSSFRVATSNTRSYTDGDVVTGSLYFLKDAVGQATRYPVLRLFFSGGTSRYVDLMLDTSTGEILSDNPSGVPVIHGYGIEDVDDAGTHWRVWITASSSSSHTGCYLALYPAVDSGALGTPYLTGTTGACTVWGGQLNRGSLLPYAKTSGAVVSGKRTRVRSTTDWTPSDPITSVFGGSDAIWTSGAVTALVTSTSSGDFVYLDHTYPIPMYELTGDNVGGRASNKGILQTWNSVMTPGKRYVFSWYGKEGGEDFVRFVLSAYGATITNTWDLKDGSHDTQDADSRTDFIDPEYIGNGIYRFAIGFTPDADVSGNFRFYINETAASGTIDMDGTSSIILGGLQIEQLDSGGPSRYVHHNPDSVLTQGTYSLNNLIYSYKGAVQPTKLATGPYPGFTDAEYKMNKVKYARNVMRHTPRRRYR